MLDVISQSIIDSIVPFYRNRVTEDVNVPMSKNVKFLYMQNNLFPFSFDVLFIFLKNDPKFKSLVHCFIIINP